MHIYFINRRSKIEPLDIRDAHRQSIIRIGDVIIRETDKGTSFLMVISNANKWNACRCLEQSSSYIGLDGNTLLFSFEGIHQRRGNVKIITQLQNLFHSSPVIEFIDNALAILTYKCDLWDANIFYKIHSSFPAELLGIEDKKQIKSSRTFEYLFETYLDNDSNILFRSLLEQNKALREIYIEIREKYPTNFRKALKLFLKENPKATIYDKA